MFTIPRVIGCCSPTTFQTLGCGCHSEDRDRRLCNGNDLWVWPHLFIQHTGFDGPITTTTAKTITEEKSERRTAAQRQDISQRQDSTTTVVENVVQKQLEHKEAPKTRNIPITTTQLTESGEGWVQDVHEEIGKPVQTTTRHYTQEESLNKKNEKLISVQPLSSTEDHHIQKGETQQVIGRKHQSTFKI